MKKSIVMILTVFALVFLLSACLDSENPSETTVTSGFEPTVTEGEPTVTDEIKPTVAEDEPTATEAIEPTATSEATHVHAWEDVLGEHARICTDCHEKQLKSEACNFVRTNCELPRECTICHATDGAPPEEHEMKIIGREQSCWYIDITEACSKCGMEVGMCGTLALPAHLWEEKTADGKTTLARLYEGDEVIRSAEAKCSPDDNFKFEVGAELAFNRLLKTETPVEKKFYNGKVICVDNAGHNFYTKGKIYEFKDGRMIDDEGDSPFVFPIMCFADLVSRSEATWLEVVE
jgi:hypothetical protein